MLFFFWFFFNLPSLGHLGIKGQCVDNFEFVQHIFGADCFVLSKCLLVDEKLESVLLHSVSMQPK